MINRKTMQIWTICGAIAIVGALASQAPAGLVAYYSFDASDATDDSGNGNDGVVGSNVDFVSDTPTALGSGNSARRNATSDGLITVDDTVSEVWPNDQMTVSFWIKAVEADNTGFNRILGKSNGTTSGGWVATKRGGSPGNPALTNNTYIRTDTSADTQQANGLTAGIGAFDGTWNHVAYTLDNGTIKEYLNGNLTATETYAHGTGFDTSTTDFEMLGTTITGENNSGTMMFQGLLDDVAVWDEVLSDSEISDLADGTHSPLTIPEPATIALLGMGAAFMAARRSNNHA